jgi:hypothetical protein
MGLQTTGYRSANRGYWEGLVAEPENPLALASKQVNMKLPLSPAGTRNSAGVLLFNEAQVCQLQTCSNSSTTLVEQENNCNRSH